MDVPRLNKTFATLVIDAAILSTFRTLGVRKTNQGSSPSNRGFSDVFVMLPTGSGKGLCFVALPLVFDSLSRAANLTTVSSQQQAHTLIT